MKFNSSSKPKILIFVRRYLPGYKSGGPVRSIEAIVEKLSCCYDFFIVTHDRDSFDYKRYPNITINVWTQVGPSYVYYTDEKLLSRKHIRSLVEAIRPDFIYLNSLFSWAFSIRIFISCLCFGKINIKFLIAPRGELSIGALSHKKFKKYFGIKLWWLLFRIKRADFHVSSDLEASEVQLYFGKGVPVHVCENLRTNGVLRLPIDHNPRAMTPLKICFFGRIVPKKNLDFALVCLNGLNLAIQFDVYGMTVDSGYYDFCRRKAEELPPNIVVNFKGPIPNTDVIGVMNQYHLFFLPTKGENFGHVIIEALLSGLPVLISDQTPWRNLADLGVGWEFSLREKSRFIESILYLGGLSPQEWSILSRKSRNFAVNWLDNPNRVKGYIQMFNSLLK